MHTRMGMSELHTQLGRGVREVWRDDDLWVLDKPPGTLSHPNPPAINAANALIRADYDYDRELYRLPAGSGTKRVWLIHRLDRDTSGLILCAFSPEAVERLKQALQRRAIQKEYRALVLGIPGRPRGEWRDHLERTQRDGRIEVEVVRKNSPNASVEYETVRQWPKAGLSLLALSPREGRTHQIRVQCARHDHPIAGDDRYGDFTANRHLARETGLKRMFLVAHGLELEHPTHGERLRFEAGPRPELESVMTKLEALKTKIPRKTRRSRSSRPH